MNATAACNSVKMHYRSRIEYLDLDSPEESISTGSVRLNSALGTGGYPRGRLTEIYGKSDSGKTTLGLAAAYQAQRAGLLTAYLDQEFKLSKNRINQAGVLTEKTLFCRFPTAKESLVFILRAINTGKFALIVLDSLGSMFPDEELDCTDGSEMESLFQRALPRMAAFAAQTKTCVLLLNQVREDPGVVYSNPLTTPGGHVLNHSCSMRIMLTRNVAIKKHDSVILGSVVKAEVTKNCVAAPRRIAELAITHSGGLDPAYEALSIAQERGMLSQSDKPYLEYRGDRLGVSLTECYEYLQRHPTVASALINEVHAMDSAAAVAV